ncbi:MAG TPA: glycoside hydrolase family 88 protein [Parafilimonas sp.]|nr:glycoside hydrolase family 88 protein [Parafilimonas sp.]
MQKKLIIALSFVIAAAFHCAAQNNTLNEIINKNFSDADAQYKVMMKLLPAGQFPKTFENDSLRLSGPGWWCSGFYPGSLLYIYEQTKDTVLYNEAIRMLGLLEKEQYNTGTHDLGFMMYCSFGNALRLNPNNEAYKEILINSARSLATRFNSAVGCIKSWDSKPSDFLVIIDNMMNLELLFWATHETGDSSFYKIAVTHANTTMKHHFRDDYSSYHVLNYNPETGAIQQKRTAQGAADSSAWARGQAWGLYGYIVMYRETHDKKYLDQANHIAGFLLNNPNLPPDKIPYWDYDAPGIPNALRDASAAAIMASAFIELSSYSDKEDAKKYINAATTILTNLSSEKYKAAAGTNGGFLLKHSVGHLPGKSEVDVPLTYADYYFLEAMKRYKEKTSGL